MNRWSFQQSFTPKFGLFFVLTLEKDFSERFHFKANRKSKGSSKKSTRVFKIALRLRGRPIFRWQSEEISNVFNTLTLRQIFWKTKTFFKKLEYRFLVEHTKTENASIHTKLLYQKPMLRQTEWLVQNGPIIKKRVLPVTTLFLENFVSV